MDTERLYRVSMPGIIFLVSFLIFYLCRGGNLDCMIEFLKTEKLATLIAFVLTTPILGLILSAIGFGVIFLLFGYKLHINYPYPSKDKTLPQRNLIAIVLPLAHSLIDELKSKQYLKKRRALKEFYWYYQAYIRAKLNGETIKFLSRRWNFFWIHFNSAFAILFSFVFSLCFKLTYNCEKQPIMVDKSILYPVTAALMIYFIAAIYQVIILRNDAIRVEEEAIIRNEEEGLKEKLKNSNIPTS